MRPIFLFCAGVFFFTLLLSRRLSAQRPSGQLVGRSGQLIVVITDGWQSVSGKGFAFERTDGHWASRFTFSVVIGAQGFGPGAVPEGWNTDGAATAKKEGDNKSPAGIYSFGTVFGYAPPEETHWLKMPYIQASDDLICVDDTESVSYNRLVKIGSGSSDYGSFEKMHLHGDEYKWGIFINHNAPETKPGKGSCIFLHVWTNDHTGTAGCTAMAEEDILKVLSWMDSGKNPLLVQMPYPEYRQLTDTLGLPAIVFP